jgi:hypothetical protein
MRRHGHAHPSPQNFSQGSRERVSASFLDLVSRTIDLLFLCEGACVFVTVFVRRNFLARRPPSVVLTLMIVDLVTAMCAVTMRTDAASLLHRGSASSSSFTRRSILASGTALALGLTSARPASADGLSSDFVGLPKYAEPRADSPLSKQRDALADPFAAARQDDPNRARRFVDELPPMTAAERRKAQQKAAEEIWSLENKARPDARVSKQAAAPSIGGFTSLDDEFTLEFDSSKPIGLKLKDLRVGFELGTTAGTSRVLVSDVTPGGQAASAGRIEIDMIVVAVDGVNVEKASAKDVSVLLARAKAESLPVKVTFKDALAFNEKLASRPSPTEDAMAPVSTKIAPGGGGQAEQVLTIQRLEVAERCTRNANAGDLVEIRYTGRLAGGTVFDGMELADRFGDDSLQFVLYVHLPDWR